MGGLTRSPRPRIVALVVGSLAGLAMIIVGCTSVTDGSPKVNATDAPLYKASVSASAEESAASSSSKEAERQESMPTEAVHASYEAFASSSVDSITAEPAIDSLNQSADTVAASMSDPLPPELRDALNAWVDAARGVANAIAGNYGPDEFNAAVSKLNDVKTTAIDMCDAAYR